jgi:hypothetical protein
MPRGESKTVPWTKPDLDKVTWWPLGQQETAVGGMWDGRTKQRQEPSIFAEDSQSTFVPGLTKQLR